MRSSGRVAREGKLPGDCTLGRSNIMESARRRMEQRDWREPPGREQCPESQRGDVTRRRLVRPEMHYWSPQHKSGRCP